MCALSQFFESEGLATTGISLVREHAAAMRPPRSLWVPFPLGRPLGAPNAPEFQRAVLEAALALLDRADGPVVLEDYPQDAPAMAGADDDEEGLACPVAFPAAEPDPNDLPAALRHELDSLAPWYQLALDRRGRTTVGASGLPIPEAADFVAAHLEGDPALYSDTLDRAQCLKLACEDLKAFYQEAVTARPGPKQERRDHQGIIDWLWRETVAGRVMARLYQRLAADPDAAMRRLASDAFFPRRQREHFQAGA